ncbi:hypothetical protein ATN79_28745 [Paraburkholderia caribensis]|nr:hypothetical protein ATN79_28745 [Paraburkholderia caribensis]
MRSHAIPLASGLLGRIQYSPTVILRLLDRLHYDLVEWREQAESLPYDYPGTERLGQRVWGSIDLSHGIDFATPFACLLIWVTNLDDLCMRRPAQKPQHHAVAVLCLVKKDEVGFVRGYPCAHTFR